MEYFLFITLIFLILIYIFSFITTLKYRKLMSFYVFLSEIIFILLGYFLNKFFIHTPFVNYYSNLRTMAIIIISFIAFLSGFEFNKYRILKIHPYNKIFLLISIIIITAIFNTVFYLFNHRISQGIIYTSIFISGSSFAFIPYNKDRILRRIIFTGILSPIVYVLLFMVFYLLFSIIFHLFANIIFLILFTILCVFIVFYIRIFNKKFVFTEILILSISILLILNPIGTMYNFNPAVLSFLLGMIFSNILPRYTNYFLELFTKSLKPLFYILLFICGIFITFDLKTIFIFVLFLIIKMIIQFILYKKFLLINKFHFIYTGIFGTEFIFVFSLFLMHIINSNIMAGFLLFMILSQIIQKVFFYVYSK